MDLNAPPPAPPKPYKLTGPMHLYDFSKEPLWSADFVIDSEGKVCKHRKGTAGRPATAKEIERAEPVEPNRR